MQKEYDKMEERIIEVAKSLFIEKGFAETSMSDIASKVGINRPVLHYYFRTKSRMFQAVFGGIVMSVAPSVFSSLSKRDMPIEHRIKEVVDTYYTLFTSNPRLPMFIIREMNRDASLLINTASNLGMPKLLKEVAGRMQQQMDDGLIRKMPLRFFFYSLYGLMTMPFLTRDVGQALLLEQDETFADMMEKWKPYLIEQMTQLLKVRSPGSIQLTKQD